MEKKLSPAIKFIQTTGLEKELLDIYRELRRELLKAKFKQEQLTNVDKAPFTVWSAHNKLFQKFQEIKKLVARYGLDGSDLGPYTEIKFAEIDKEIPLD